MAWVPDQEKDNQLKRQATSPGTQGGGLATPAPTPAAKPQGSGSWGGVIEFLNKNKTQGQAYGNKIAGGVNNAANTARNDLNTGVGNFNAQVTAATPVYDQKKVDAVRKDPLANPGFGADVKKMASGKYGGPTALAPTASIGAATKAAADPFGGKKVSSLDNALLRFSGGQKAIDSSVANANSLVGEQDAATKAAAQRVAEATAAAKAVGEQTARNPLTAFNTTLTQSDLDSLLPRVSSGSSGLSDQELQKMGITRGEWDGLVKGRLDNQVKGKSVGDLSKYLTANVASQGAADKDSALADIFGRAPVAGDGLQFDLAKLLPSSGKSMTPQPVKKSLAQRQQEEDLRKKVDAETDHIFGY